MRWMLVIPMLAQLFCHAHTGTQAAPPTRTVLVANDDMSAGDSIDDAALFHREPCLPGERSRGVVTSFDKLKGKALLHNVAKGQPLRDRDLGQVVTVEEAPHVCACGYPRPHSTVSVLADVKNEPGKTTCSEFVRRAVVVGVVKDNSRSPITKYKLAMPAADAARVIEAAKNKRIEFLLSLRYPGFE